MLGGDDVQTLCAVFLTGHRAHLGSLTADLSPMERAVVIRDGTPSYVGRAYIYDFLQTVPGAKEAISMAMRKANITPAEIPAILGGMCYDDLTELATSLVFKPRTPEPAAGKA